MNLNEAPFHQKLQISRLEAEGEEKTILEQLGLGLEEQVEKVHQSPLGDPIALRIGEQIFSLRRIHAEKIIVEILK